MAIENRNLMKIRESEAAQAVFAFGWLFHSRLLCGSLLGGCLLCGSLLCGCSVNPEIEAGNGEDENGNGAAKEIPIRIATEVTRVADEKFEDGDVLGLFVVNEPDALETSGNQYDNEPLMFVGGVLTSRELYYRDERTVTDFYCYFPYSRAVENVEALPFSVNSDQSTPEGYNGSDFLWGRTTGVLPTENLVNIPMRHLTSCLKVVLKAGAGWTAEELAGAKVTVCGLKTAGFANLKDGSVAAGEGTSEIVARNEGGGVFSALVVPQGVVNAELVKIAAGTDEYVLRTSVDLRSGREHICTVPVNKTGGSINVGIVGWETDGTDHGGSVE